MADDKIERHNVQGSVC